MTSPTRKYLKEFAKELVEEALDASFDWGYALGNKSSFQHIELTEAAYQRTAEKLYKFMETILREE